MPKSTFVRELERLMKSPDERVRLIAAQSLARIGTARKVKPNDKPLSKIGRA